MKASSASSKACLRCDQCFQEMPDIAPAAFAARADEGRRHLHLVERLVPDVVEPLRLRHPRPDAGIDEVEEEQSGDALRRAAAPAAASARRRRRDRRCRPASSPSASISASMSAACWSGPNSPSGLSLSPKPRRSGAYSVKRSASRVMTGSQVSQNSGQPCSNSSGRPAPMRATWNAAPLARTVKCSIFGSFLLPGPARISWPRALSGPPSSPRTRPDRGSRNRPSWRLERWQSGRMHRTRNAA